MAESSAGGNDIMLTTPQRRAALTAVVAIMAVTCTFILADDAAKPAPVKPATAAAPAAAATAEAAPNGEPAHVTIQHILIGFEGTVPGKNITRTQEAARALAADVLARARKGEDFDALVKQYTDDRAPGIYSMANNNVTPATPRPGSRATGREYARGTMVKSFGDVSFSLKVGEIGMAEYDHTNSKFGWHIIKRLE
jgi:parvulin-like peptidyl-prolyl cis-trans isomerase-like protein